MPSVELPRLRAIDARPIAHRGEPALLLRDPLKLTDRYVVLPRRYAPLLVLCDGTRDSAGLRASLMIRHGMRETVDRIEQILHALDEALLLDSETFREALDEARQAYRKQPFREPASAGASYPADAGELRAMLQEYAQDAPVGGEDGPWRGLVSPHIDFARGGPVYASVWHRMSQAVIEADVAVVVGTDHNGADGRITLTRQHYATPYGVLPTDVAAVEHIAEAIGGPQAFVDELHHRSEHSIELAAVWLHHTRDGASCQVVPILCGSFGRFLRGQGSPLDDPVLGALVRALQEVMAERRALLVAAADLAHVGPAFGGSPVDFAGRARVKAADDEIIAAACAGDAERVYRAVEQNGGRYNVCGLAPIYIALRALAPSGGERIAYDLCPADDRGTSLVSICGLSLR
jgi:AmmeMemoRadiSam system protein B